MARYRQLFFTQTQKKSENNRKMEKTTNIPSEKRITYDSNVYMKTDSH